eukprot:c19960_g2_i2.p1 GENE.c19960_g2_i2~~c19960_g2_i2.p1  ORF type:complete len:177 (+),score=37.88 c19960_g2_i2:53-583(+)
MQYNTPLPPPLESKTNGHLVILTNDFILFLNSFCCCYRRHQRTPQQHVCLTLAEVPAPDLDTALVFLPMSHVFRLLEYLSDFIDKGQEVELCVRTVLTLMRAHHTQIISNKALTPVMLRLQRATRSNVQRLKTTIGVNLAAMTFLKRQLEDGGSSLFSEAQKSLNEKQASKRKRRK